MDIDKDNSSEIKDSSPKIQDNIPLDSSHTSSPKIANIYTGLESKPFLVCLRSKDKNIAHLHPMKIGKILFASGSFPSVSNIKASSRKQLELYFDNYQEANKFIASDICEQHNVEAFIPFSRTHSIGIIRGVFPEFTTEEILHHIRTDSNAAVINVYRFNRRTLNEDGHIEYLPTQTCKITVKSPVLPRKVFLYNIACEVERYRPPLLQCHKCQLFGHTDKFCKGSITCGTCSKDHKTDDCEGTIVQCPNCSGPHKTRSLTCESYKLEKLIHDKMTSLNLTRYEAKNIVMGKTTYAQLLSDRMTNTESVAQTSPTGFPSLPPRSRTPSNTTTSPTDLTANIPRPSYDIAKKRKIQQSCTSPQPRHSTPQYGLPSILYRHGRLPEPHSVPATTASLSPTFLPYTSLNSLAISSTCPAPLPNQPMSESAFLGSINAIINEIPGTFRQQLENIKLNQLWFYQNRHKQ